MTGEVRFAFESNAKGKWVGVLHDSVLVDGAIATQDAGTNTVAGHYYQLGGGGVNLLFQQGLAKAGLADDVDDALRAGYDAYYGAGAYQADASAMRRDRLTTFLVELTPDGNHVGSSVRALAYSVGPVLGRDGIVDHATYQAIYTDAVEGIAAWNAQDGVEPLVGLRITMLSCGIYANRVDDADGLYATAAKDIILGLAAGFARWPQPGFTVLINTNDAVAAPRERPAFTAATAALGLQLHHDGFVVDPAATAG